LDYLVVRDTHEQKSGRACRQREGPARIHLHVAAGYVRSNLGGEIGLPGSQRHTRAKIREGTPAAGRVGPDIDS
jgi:hypothetical protein